MTVKYPLFVFEKDDQSMLQIENASNIDVLEAVDILNDEYVFWDADGNGVSIAASVTRFTMTIGDATPCVALFPLRDALVLYAKKLGLPNFSVDGPPGEVWGRIQKELAARPKKPSFLARLFR
jgi:hypothetical protein